MNQNNLDYISSLTDIETVEKETPVLCDLCLDTYCGKWHKQCIVLCQDCKDQLLTELLKKQEAEENEYKQEVIAEGSPTLEYLNKI